MTERSSIIDTAQECSDVEDRVLVADSIGYGRLYTPITNMTREVEPKTAGQGGVSPRKC